MSNNKLLSIKKLTIKIGDQIILSNVSFDLKKNEVLGLVGESGSGKSFTALSVLDLIHLKNLKTEGKIIFNGRELNELSKKEYQKIRGKEISMIMSAANVAPPPIPAIPKELIATTPTRVNMNVGSSGSIPIVGAIIVANIAG